MLSLSLDAHLVATCEGTSCRSLREVEARQLGIMKLLFGGPCWERRELFLTDEVADPVESSKPRPDSSCGQCSRA